MKITYLLLFISFFVQSLYGQSFNGVIYKTIEHDSSPFTRMLSENTGFEEEEHKIYHIKSTICEDTLVIENFGRDSLFTWVFVQMGHNYFLGADTDSTFTPVSKSNSFSDEKLIGTWERKNSEQILGFDIFKHQIKRNSGSILTQYVAKSLHFPDSYTFGNKYRTLFTKKGVILKNIFIDNKGFQSITTVYKIEITKCNCDLILRKLSFYENIDSSEGVINLDEFLGN